MKKINFSLRQIFENITGIEIDRRIPSREVAFYFVKKCKNLLRGFIVFKNFKTMISKNVKIKNKKQLKIDSFLNIDHDVYLDALSENGIQIGKHVSIGCFTRIECTGSLSFLGKGFKCGNNCGLGTDCFYGAAGGIEIGNDVIVGNFVSIHSENHNYSNPEIPIRLQGVNHKGIKIGSNCWIGAKATILDGSIIGDGCIVAAGAVVTGVFPDNVIIGGVPAKVIKRRTNQ